MSVSFRNQTSGILERVAGFSDTDAVLSPTSRNPIQNKAVHDALAQKIDKTVSDLENYYTTAQTYNKQEVRELIGSINTLTIEVVSTLPTQDISSTTIYFLGPAAGTNTYEEYVYVNNAWVKIGDTDIDLSNYVTSAQLTTALQNYYTKSATDSLFNDYYDKDTTDDLLDLKQDVLTFDNTPTSGSSNPVTSNGIRTAISNAIVSSAGGSIIKVHHIEGAAAAGDKAYATKGTYKSEEFTFDSNGDAIIIGVGEIGNITVTATNGSESGSTVINIPSFSNYSTNISYGLDYKSWLLAGGINPTYYESLDEVLVDEEAIRKLMTIHASIDYMVSSVIKADDESAIKIINNDLCAKWINLRDYAIDTLSTNTYIAAMMDDADKYIYGEWTFADLVPIMTSNTAPYGTVIYSSAYSGYSPYYAFTRSSNQNTKFVANGTTNQYLGYIFEAPTKVSSVYIENEIEIPSQGVKTCKIQYSDNNSTWNDASEVETLTEKEHKYIKVTNQDAHLYWRIYILTNLGHASYTTIKSAQFYAWQPKGNIPVMISNTSPYGTAIANSEFGSGQYNYSAFDNNPGTTWSSGSNTYSGAYIGYQFMNPVNIRKIKYTKRYLTGYGMGNCSAKVQASIDGITWVDLTDTLTFDQLVTSVPNVNREITWDAIYHTDEYFMYFRLYFISISSGQDSRLHPTTAGIQIYGREIKVSAPIMTSNTTPYGEAFGSSIYSTEYDYYKAFAYSTLVSQQQCWLPAASDTLGSAYVGYDFGKPIKLTNAKIGYSIGASNITNVHFKIQGSNDKFVSDIHDLTNDIGITTFNTLFNYNINNNEKYRYYRLLYLSNSADEPTRGRGWFVQFYGIDYSEYDWDTEHPRYYLYDHGCLKDFTYTQTYETSASRLDGVVISRSDSEEYKFTSGTVVSDTTWFFIDKQIDMSQYSKVFINYLTYGGNYNGFFAVCASKVANPSYLASITCPMNTKSITAIDVSSVNTNGYVTIGIHNDDIYCSEFWLE